VSGIDTSDPFHRGLLADDGGSDPLRRRIFAVLREPRIAAFLHIYQGEDSDADEYRVAAVRLSFNQSAAVVADAVLAALDPPSAARQAADGD
jgi:hypothetical protein